MKYVLYISVEKIEGDKVEEVLRHSLKEYKKANEVLKTVANITLDVEEGITR